jgi:hypothetical protein
MWYYIASGAPRASIKTCTYPHAGLLAILSKSIAIIDSDTAEKVSTIAIAILRKYIAILDPESHHAGSGVAREGHVLAPGATGGEPKTHKKKKFMGAPYAFPTR